MMPTLTQEMYISERRQLRSARTAFNKTEAYKNTPPNVVAALTAAVRLARVARQGRAVFDEHGYPDQWFEWSIAEEDARRAIIRLEGQGGSVWTETA